MTLLHEAARTTTPGSRWRRLVRPGILAGVVTAGTAYVAAVDPNRPGHYPVCPTYALAGIYCPGCGMLRATHDLTHLDLAGAMARNPLAPFLLLGLVLLFLVWARARWEGRPLVWYPPRWTPWVLAVGFVAYTVARNVPGWTLLSPA